LFAEGKFPYDENFEIFCRAIANAVMLFDLPVVAIGGRIGGRLKKEKLNKIYDFLPHHFEPEIRIIKDDFMVAKGACFLAKTLL
jgi:glucokinase/N-acetylglucosamine kinase